MARQWLLDQPEVIDLAADGGRVRTVVVALVAGRVDVLADEGSPGARLEVSQVDGLPLRVSWDGRTLRVLHGKPIEQSVLDVLKRVAQNFGGNRATVTLRVPAETKAVISTASAATTVTGLRRPVTVNTFSGPVTLTDVSGKVSVNTVTGATQCTGLQGEARLVTVSAPVTVRASDLPSARLNTVGGAVTLDLTNGRAQVWANSVTGAVTLRGPFTGYAVTAHTAGGTVVVDGRTLERTGSGGTAGSATLRDGDESFALHANVATATVTVVRTPGGGPQDAVFPPSFPAAAPQPPSPQPPSPQPPSAEPQDAPAKEWEQGEDH